MQDQQRRVEVFLLDVVIVAEVHVLLVEHLDHWAVLGEVVEQGVAAEDLVELFEVGVLSDQQVVLVELGDVLPEGEVAAGFGHEEAVRVLDTKVASVIPEYLALVQVLVADTVSSEGVLDHHLLRDLVLEVDDLILIHEVVKLIVHTSYDVVLRFLVPFAVRLVHGEFNVFFAVPGSDDQDILNVVFTNDLYHVFALVFFNL